MKRLCLIIAVALFSGALNAQAHFALDPFDKIEVRNTFKVTLIPSDRHEIVFPDTAWFEDSDVDPSDLYTVQAGTLRLAFKIGSHRFLHPQKEPILIHFVSLTNLNIAGSVSVTSEATIQSARLDVDISGASSAKLDVNTDLLGTELSGTSTLILSGIVGEHRSQVSGASTLNLSGTANFLSFVASGSSIVNAEKCETKESAVHISGASSARLNTKTVQGEVSGVSELKLNADAESQVQRKGGASISKKDGRKITVVTDEKLIEESAFPTDDANEAAEDGSELEDTLDDLDKEIHKFKYSYHKKRKQRFEIKYSSIDIGFNGFGQDPFQNTLPTGYENMELSQNTSMIINVNLFDYGIRFGKSGFGIGAGLGIGWNIYKFLEPSMIPAKDKTTGMFVLNPYAGTENLEYKKSKLQSSWLKVPLFLQYQNNDFTLSAGVVGNVRLGASTKQVYTHPETGKERKKSKSDFYLNGFRADAEMRVSYKGLGLFATYSLTNMFVKNHGPELQLYSFGVSVWVD